MIFLIHFILVSFIYIVIKKEKNLYLTYFIYTTLLFGQRWEVGTDFPGYIRLFLNDKVTSLIYTKIQFFIKSNLIDFQMLIFIVLLITSVNIFYSLYKISYGNKFLIFIFMLSEIYFQQMSQIRQYLAISFFLLSIKFLIDKKGIIFMFLFTIGVLIHKSLLLLLLPIILTYKLKISKLCHQLILIFLFIIPFINFSIFIKYLPLGYSSYIGSVYAVDLSIANYMKYYAMISLFSLSNLYFGESRKSFFEYKWLILYFFLYGVSFKFAIVIRMSAYVKVFEIFLLAFFMYRNNFFTKKLSKFIALSVTLLNFIGLAILDPYDITPFEYKKLEIKEKNDYKELLEIYNKVQRGEYID